jgi:hypothetical protein
LSLSLLLAGCGTALDRAQTAAPNLPGWRAVDDPPGVSELAPGLDGLTVVRVTDTRALVGNGDAVRASTFTFASARDAAEAQKLGAGDDYQGQLERAFHGETVAHGPGVGLRLRVPRATDTGSDVAEVYLLAAGPRLTLVELVSARGFDPGLRGRILRLLSRRTAAG